MMNFYNFSKLKKKILFTLICLNNKQKSWFDLEWEEMHYIFDWISKLWSWFSGQSLSVLISIINSENSIVSLKHPFFVEKLETDYLSENVNDLAFVHH